MPDGDPANAVRRAPFADNPTVGARGHLAQQRILEAGLQVFGEVGYHQCRVQRIAELAGCSRVSFYQYFSSKEDLFRHLAGRVARELEQLVASLEPITPDAAGRATLVTYFERYAGLYDAHQPIFVAFQAAASADEVMAEGGARVGAHVLDGLVAKVQGSPLDHEALVGAVRVIIESAVRANRVRELVQGGSPAVALSRARVDRALADVAHRALFGADPEVNVAEPAGPRAFPRHEPAAAVEEAPKRRRRVEPGPSGRQTRDAVLAAGHRVYVERGYYGTRVDDIVRVAGVSHGVFYRYFRNKDELFRLLAQQASGTFGTFFAALGDIDLTAPGAIEAYRAWLEGYIATCSEASAILRVWADAIARDPELGSDSARAVREACRGIIRMLGTRGSGDVEAEAVVLMVLLDAITSGRPSPRRIESLNRVIERAILLAP